jgi:hypothetical protein
VALEAVEAEPIAWRWLAPAMALCIVTLIVLARNPRAGLGDSARYRLMPTFALSNVDFSTYFAAAGQGDHNILQRTFEWTNGAHSSTTGPSIFERTGYQE